MLDHMDAPAWKISTQPEVTNSDNTPLPISSTVVMDIEDMIMDIGLLFEAAICNRPTFFTDIHNEVCDIISRRLRDLVRTCRQRKWQETLLEFRQVNKVFKINLEKLFSSESISGSVDWRIHYWREMSHGWNEKFTALENELKRKHVSLNLEEWY